MGRSVHKLEFMRKNLITRGFRIWMLLKALKLSEITREGSLGREGFQNQKLHVLPTCRDWGDGESAEEAEKSGQRRIGKKTRMVWCLGSQVKKAF